MSDPNLTLFEFLFQWSGQGPLFDALVVFLARFLLYISVAVFIVWIFSVKDWMVRWLVFMESALAIILGRGIIAETIRFFYHNSRPFAALNLEPLLDETSYSFPSGHASFLFALATAVFYYNRRLGFWFFAIAFVNGLARIMAGVHWPLDILGGIAVGVLSAMVVHELVKPQAKKISEGRELA